VKELPTIPAEGRDPDDTATGSGPPVPPQVASSKLIATLAIAGALAGLVIVLVFQWADPQIQAHREAALRAAVLEVLNGPASYRSLYVTPDGLVEKLPEGSDTVTAEKVFLGFDASGAPAGYAVTGAEPGFQDVIQLIFGYDVDSGRLLGMKVLESKETPGLGDKIIKDMNFVNGFQGVSAPIVGVKQGAGTGSENEVDMITGATISSRAVIGIINHRLEALGPALTEHEPGPAPQAPPVATADSSAGAGGDEGS
jgi:H+/Na+-translocating ferredoxin:NAD+ oxidoreductase subunit G